MGANSPAVACPRCGQSNSWGTISCWKCQSSLAGLTPVTDSSDASETIIDADLSSGSFAAGDSGAQDIVVDVGSVLVGRYEITRKIGQGGMGSVFQAHDRELDRIVALKTIRSEMAGNAMVMQRFKQELLLARKISHRNIIRIFDIGSAGNTKFITMDFIEGKELSELMAEKRLSLGETVRIAKQVCLALEAAHNEGVIHRDLKPQNVMVDGKGRVVVMDFGLARATEGQGLGLTQTGVMMGTPLYMSPEQVNGTPLDGRSDIYAFGIMLYEMLTGSVPFRAETMVATLIKRTREAPPPPITVDPAIPQILNDIVVGCTAVNRDDRYSNATEILADLNIWEGTSSGSAQRTSSGSISGPVASRSKISTHAIPAPTPVAPAKSRKALYVGVGALALSLVAGGVWWKFKSPDAPKIAPGTHLITLVGDFQNKTGDPVFDGAIEPMFTVALEGASFITSFNRAQARQFAGQIRPGATKLDPEVSRLVALREGINVVISGVVEKSGDTYVMTATALDGVKGTRIAEAKETASQREDLLAAIPKLAHPIRRALGDTVPESTQLAAAETFSTSSLEAVQAYSRGQDAQSLGKTDEAIGYYNEALKLDPKFGRAYSGLGVIYRNLRQREHSEQYFQLALKHIGQMTERERYRTRGAYYILTGNYPQARDEYTRLVKEYPADSAAYANLSITLLYLRDMPKAIEEGKKALAIYPKNISQRLNVALFLLYSGDFDGARKEAQTVLDANPKFEAAVLVQALSAVGKGNMDEAAGVYDKLAALGPRGASMAAIGKADLALYGGRVNDAIAILQTALPDDIAAKNTGGVARKQLALAYAALMQNRNAQAVAAATVAAATTKDAGTLLGVGLVYVNAGQDAKARILAEQLRGKLDFEAKAYSLLIEGALDTQRGRATDAVSKIREAQGIVDTWVGRFLLGQAYLEAKAYTEADSEFDLCAKRRGEVLDLFFDYVPTARYLPLVSYYQGRVHEALGSPSAADHYRAFLKDREKGEPDSLVADARRRLK